MPYGKDPVHVYVPDDMLDDACEALDEAGVPYDMDGGDRLMIDQDYLDEALGTLDGAGIDYEEI